MLTSLARIAPAVIAVALALPSAASADSVEVDFPEAEIVEGVPAAMHVAASADLFTRVVAKPLSPDADCSAGPIFDFSQRLFDSNEDVVDLTTSVVLPRSGRWLVCAWAGTAPARYAEQALQVLVRAPRATVRIHAPRRVSPGAWARVAVDYDVESPRRLLYAAVRGGRCGLGADAARALGARVRTLPGAIAGAGRASVSVPVPARGRWRVCAYVQRDAGPGAANAVAGSNVSVGARARAHSRQAARGEFGA
jgi:hypothetical protein